MFEILSVQSATTCFPGHFPRKIWGKRDWPLLLLFLFPLLSGLRSEVEWPDLRLREFASGLGGPVDIQVPRDGSDRLFVADQSGRIFIIRDGAVLPDPFLNITDRVRQIAGEEGLLGLAFSPSFATDGFIYVNYTTGASNSPRVSRISRFSLREGESDRADPDSEVILLRVGQPFGNHNGGQLQFGPDGFLYAGFGDGGSGGDPGDNGQNRAQLLGKLLRIDVSGDDFPDNPDRNYALPESNPFLDDPQTADEIWALGMRNPWRFSFDPLTGDLYIADVGQNRWEEIDFQPAESAGGGNYGWRIKEGRHLFDVPSGGAPEGLVDPIFEYPHGDGNISVTGGYVYRGDFFPRMRGIYFFGDFGSGRIWGLQRNGSGRWVNEELADTDFGISTFGKDEAGNLYLADLFSGTIFRLSDLGLLADGSAMLVNIGTSFLGNIYNGYELRGESGTFSSLAGEITRISFLDPGGDLVFAEFGSDDPDTLLTINLDEFGGVKPSPYDQPTTRYAQGLASFIIENSTAGTFFSVFTLGNDPKRVDLALIKNDTFAGEANGIAEVRSLSVTAPDGETAAIGGINAADANFAADSGIIGLDAKAVAVQQFLFIGNMTPSGSARPRLRISPSSPLSEILINGGDLSEARGEFAIDTAGVVYPFPINAADGQRSISGSSLRSDLGDGSLAPRTDTFVADPDQFFLTAGQNAGVKTGFSAGFTASAEEIEGEREELPAGKFEEPHSLETGRSPREGPVAGLTHPRRFQTPPRSQLSSSRPLSFDLRLERFPRDGFPWKEHLRAGRLLYIRGGAAGVWVRDMEFGWLWTSPEAYPFFWSVAERNWLRWEGEFP